MGSVENKCNIKEDKLIQVLLIFSKKNHLVKVQVIIIIIGLLIIMITIIIIRQIKIL